MANETIPTSIGPQRSLWVVTEPGPESVIEDILFESNLVGLARQFRGGLDPDDVSLFLDREPAFTEARRRLAAREKRRVR